MDRPARLMNRSSWTLCLVIILSGVYISAGGEQAFAPSSPFRSRRIKNSRSPRISPAAPRNRLPRRGGPAVPAPSEESPRRAPVLSLSPSPASHHEHPSIRFAPAPARAPGMHGRAPSPSPSPSPSHIKALQPMHATGRRSPPPTIQTAGPSPAPVISPSPPVDAPFARESKPPAAQPVPVFPPPPPPPPPPPNQCQLTLSCADPYTNPLPGSPCACVLPMKVKLRLSVALYTFFPLVSELAKEIGEGIFMDQIQVHIMGANAATGQPEKTIVLIDLLPRGSMFDQALALRTFQRFWRKEIVFNPAYFGDYDVLYVQYPGLPLSPPFPASEARDGLGGKNEPGTLDPLGVDVKRKKEKFSASIVAVAVLSSVIAIALCAAAAWFLLLKLKRRDRASRLPLLPAEKALSLLRVKTACGAGLLGGGSGPESPSGSLASYAGGPRTYALWEMERATGDFDESRVVGEGGFGRVYQGALEDGTMVAVKVLKRGDQRGGREFLAEIEMLSRLHHRNLVKLIGLCAEDRIRCLVYELIPNGSVDSYLHGGDKEAATLDWATRVKIALGSARALAYLHEDSNPPVIHRDFKSSNILLDEKFIPKVSDFGLARAALNEGKEHISTRVVGTFGYVAPEYALTGHLLVKSDVYSYGVVLLELLTGRKPVDMSQPPGEENLVAWAHPLLTNKEDLATIVDPALGRDLPFDDVAKVAAIASMCVQPEVSQRPSMGEVVQALKLVCDGGDSPRGESEGGFSSEEMEADDVGRYTSPGSKLAAAEGSAKSQPGSYLDRTSEGLLVRRKPER